MMNKTKTILLAVLCLLSPTLMGMELGGLKISVAADAYYEQGINKQSQADEKMIIREAELMFYAPIDHVWEGVLSGASHYEAGKQFFELHEAFLDTSKLIPRSEFKVGQFFLSIGRLNRFHRHDWPFVDAPKVHETFFAEEGAVDTGIEYFWIPPLSFQLDLLVGITSGYTFGHSHGHGSKPVIPTHYARLAHFFSFGGTDGLEVGLNYLGGKDSSKEKKIILGLDIAGKWRAQKTLKFLFQSETYFRKLTPIMGDYSEQVGTYIYGQYGFNPQFSLGLRLDGFWDLNLRTSKGDRKNHLNTKIGVDGEWKTSEFMTSRLTLSHQMERLEGVTLAKDTKAQLQFIFILGAHPAHTF